jgi:pseudouridine-5'-phosphate glycosidase/pseudouridine kinase
MADMSLFSSPDSLIDLPVLKSKWSVIDANWHPHISQKRLGWLKLWKSKVAYEPVSVPKSGNIFQPPSPGVSPVGVFPKHNIHLATPNQHELAAMHASAKEHDLFESERWWQVIDSLGIPSSGARDRFIALTNREMTDRGTPLQTIQLLPYIPTILTKLGPEGVLLTELLLPEDSRLTDPDAAPYLLSRNSNGSTDVGGVYMRRFPAVEIVKDIVSVNGAGDTFLGVLVAGLATGLKLDENLINIAQRGAVMTLRSKEAVSPNLGELAVELDRLASEKV